MDYYIFIPYLLLSVFGILMVYSASSEWAISRFDNPQYYFIRQAIFVFAGMIACMFAFLFKYKLLKNKNLVMLAVFVVGALLIYLVFFGEEINGATGWLQIGSFGLQPAEFAKIVIIWYFAYIFSKRQHRITYEFKESIAAPVVIFSIYLLLILFQPDIGGAAIVLLIGVVMIFSSGVSAKLGVFFGTLGVVLLAGAMELVRHFGMRLPMLEQYQYDRFLAFWDPFAVSETAGMQLVNSYYALSRGGLFGVGMGESVQKMGYLPEPYTDFIMAILGEEVGLIGVLIVLLLFFLMVLRIFLIGIRTKDPFGSLLCIGIATMFTVQASINLGGVIGLLPITGVTFPFISYGGSSILVLTLSIGVALNVSATDKLNTETEQKKTVAAQN